MPIDADTPVPLLLDELKHQGAWTLMSERLEKIIDMRIHTLVNLPGDASLAEVQRLLGQIEALRLVLKEPERLETEWRRAVAKSPAHQQPRAVSR